MYDMFCYSYSHTVDFTPEYKVVMRIDVDSDSLSSALQLL